LAGNNLRTRHTDVVASHNYFVQQLGERSKEINLNLLRANILFRWLFHFVNVAASLFFCFRLWRQRTEYL